MRYGSMGPVGLAAFAFGALLGDGFAVQERSGMTNPIAATESSIASGRQLYQRQCAICHGSSGAGDGSMAARIDGAPPSNLSDGEWDHGSTDGEVYATIREGVGPAFSMRGYKDRISEDETWHIVNFIRSLGGGS